MAQNIVYRNKTITKTMREQSETDGEESEGAWFLAKNSYTGRQKSKVCKRP